MNTDSSVYLYSGPSGVDFDANLAIDSIDYGTYHAYPDSWGVDESEYQSWGVQWIKDHASSGVSAGKPVVMEEYGVKTLNASIYQAWSDAVYAAASNMQYRQFGVSPLSTADDGYTIYDTDELFTTVIAPAAEEFAALSKSSTSSASIATSTTSVAGDASELVDTTTTGSPTTMAASNTKSESSAPTDVTSTTSSEGSTSTSAAETSGSRTSDESTSTTGSTTATSTSAATALTAVSDKCSVRRRRA